MITIANGTKTPRIDLVRIYSFLKAFWQVRKLRADCRIETALDVVYSSDRGFIRPVQIRSEIRRLLTIVAEKKPETIVEIGTASGGTLLLLSRVAAAHATLVSIDLPGGEFGGGYRRWRIPLYKSFALPRQTIRLIRGDSHRAETVAKLKAILNGRAIDFLFIDGDHSYEGVEKDFSIYRSFMASSGMIALHDIAETSPQKRCDVHRFWQEIKNEFNCTEIVKHSSRKKFGIGLITSLSR